MLRQEAGISRPGTLQSRAMASPFSGRVPASHPCEIPGIRGRCVTSRRVRSWGWYPSGLNKMKLLQAWIELHREELVADWELAVGGEQPYKIEPLK